MASEQSAEIDFIKTKKRMRQKKDARRYSVKRLSSFTILRSYAILHSGDQLIFLPCLFVLSEYRSLGGGRLFAASNIYYYRPSKNIPFLLFFSKIFFLRPKAMFYQGFSVIGVGTIGVRTLVNRFDKRSFQSFAPQPFRMPRSV